LAAGTEQAAESQMLGPTHVLVVENFLVTFEQLVRTTLSRLTRERNRPCSLQKGRRGVRPRPRLGSSHRAQVGFD